jgi:hypothetical protein
MSKIDDVRDFLIGAVFYIGGIILTISFVELVLGLIFG